VVSGPITLHKVAIKKQCKYRPIARFAPSEAEVDIAKLWFSSLGFDTDAATGSSLRVVLWKFPRISNANAELVNYYLATHLVRVLTKEPPATLERVAFYQGVIDHVRSQAS
jgi:hypothetical protein